MSLATKSRHVRLYAELTRLLVKYGRSDLVRDMRAAGFAVNVVEVADPGDFRKRYGMPDVATCHTAVVNGYAIEGHVPAREIRRLLAERPKARGLAVARMPVGAPGMEQGGRIDPYDVFLVQPDGSFTVYARYGR